jgi:hypothetical protein
MASHDRNRARFVSKPTLFEIAEYADMPVERVP